MSSLGLVKNYETGNISLLAHNSQMFTSGTKYKLQKNLKPLSGGIINLVGF